MDSFEELHRAATISVEPFSMHVNDQELADLETLLKLPPVASPTYENSLADSTLGLNRDGWLMR